VLPAIPPVALSMIRKAPLLSIAPWKNLRNTSRCQRSLLGCCSQIFGSEAVRYSASKSSGLSGFNKTAGFSSVGCRSRCIVSAYAQFGLEDGIDLAHDSFHLDGGIGLFEVEGGAHLFTAGDLVTIGGGAPDYFGNAGVSIVH